MRKNYCVLGMNNFQKFYLLPTPKRKAFCQAFLLLPYCQLCVKFLPLVILLKLFRLRTSKVPVIQFPSTCNDEIFEIAWAVTTAARYLPFFQARCLAQALTARVLLHRNHIDCTLHLGASLYGNRKLTAHAWLTSNNIIVNFGSDICSFTHIAELF